MECPNDIPLFDLHDNDTLRFLRTLRGFQEWYAPIHGKICVVLCLFGILTNAVHIAVLTRPAMRCSAVNCLLTAVAVCDMGCMASYLLYIFHFVVMKDDTCNNPYTYRWMQFLLWHVVLSIALHTTSLWLAVAMAFIRRMTLRVARLNSHWQRPQFAWRVCLAIYAAVFILCAPNLLVHEIDKHPMTYQPAPHCGNNETEPIYTFYVPKAALKNNCRLFKLNVWMIGILFKVIPCVLLFVLSIGLMLKLREAEYKRNLLMKNNNNNNNGSSYKKVKTDRTTVMLIVILVIFLITELPQGFISILVAVYTAHVHRYVYPYTGDLLDLLSLINSSVNFVLYCLMSSRYRHTFWTVVLPKSVYQYFPRRSTTANASQIPANLASRIVSAKNPKIVNCVTDNNNELFRDYSPIPNEGGGTKSPSTPRNSPSSTSLFYAFNRSVTGGHATLISSRSGSSGKGSVRILHGSDALGLPKSPDLILTTSSSTPSSTEEEDETASKTSRITATAESLL